MFITVIIPTYDRVSLLSRTLDSIFRQNYPQNRFEIIVVNNSVDKKTEILCKTFLPQIQNFNYLQDTRPGLHIGRHLGLKNAKGEILAYADDDIQASPTWLEGIAESFQDPQVVLVGGKNLPDFESEPPAWVEQLWEQTPWGKANGYFSLLDFGDEPKTISPYYVWGCNFSIRREVLLELGGFHPDAMPSGWERFRGDGETAVAAAIQARGLKTVYNPKASLLHFVSRSRMTYDYLYRRAFLQGISDSYTKIRLAGKVTRRATFLASARKWKNLVKIYYHGAMIHPDTLTLILQKGYWNGIIFHIREIKNDPSLLQWVLRPNYLE